MPSHHAWSHGRIGPGSQFLDPVVLQRIGNLELIARGVVEGFLHGLHRSPFFGQSVDFAEHRPYTPGDDLRRVDWKAFARTDRYYVKEFEAETNTNFTVLLDTSRSMAFGEGEVSKFDYGSFLAASLSFLTRKQGDRVGILTFDSEVRDVVPCSARHLELVLLTIDRSQPDRRGELGPALRDVMNRKGKRGLVALISDLYIDPEELRSPMNQLREMGSDVMVFHVLDSAELDLPYKGKVTLEDMETKEVLPMAPEELREEYRKSLTTHVAEMGRVLTSVGADHILADTSQPLDQALFHYLLARGDRMRTGTGRWASLS